MAGKISVTPGDLRTSANKVNGYINEYTGQYKKLISNVQNLGSSWKGEANQKYTKQIEGFEKEFQNLKDVLDAYVLVLNRAADIYQKTEENIASSASKLATGR